MGSIKKFFSKNKRKDDVLADQELESLDAEGVDMVRGIVELSQRSVKEVMIPRIDTVFIPEEADMEENRQKLIDSGHSRFPVYRETIDNVVGVLYVKDLLPFLMRQEPVEIIRALRPAYFVPESMKLGILLREMKQRRVHIAVAVDEYGGVSGIITMEDIIEEIVGDIQDEFDNEGEEIIEVGDNTWICDARFNLEDLNQELNIELPTDRFDSLGGFVFNLFGKIPGSFEKIRWNDLSFVIQAVEGHRIKQVKLIKEAVSDEKD